MRSALTLLATAAASAAFVLAAPVAHADSGGWNHDDSSYSKEHDNGTKHEEPQGGMHTGGGALSVVNEGDRGGSGDSQGEKSWGGDEQEKPRGGMHTGGGGLADNGMTAGGLAVLGVAATGLYAARRRKSARGAA